MVDHHQKIGKNIISCLFPKVCIYTQNATCFVSQSLSIGIIIRLFLVMISFETTRKQVFIG